MSSTPEEDFENAKAICANLGLPEPKEEFMTDDIVKRLAEKIAEALRGDDTQIDAEQVMLLESILSEAMAHNCCCVTDDECRCFNRARNEAYTRAAEIARNMYPVGGAHTYASENCDIYLAAENAGLKIAAAIEGLKEDK